ncbi:MAG: hypothetical protein AAF843_08445 [Bacteroidota bacterium]
MTSRNTNRFQHFLLVLGITVTLSLSGFCWFKVLYPQSDIKISGLQNTQDASRLNKKVVFLGGIFFGVTKYLTTDQ